MLELQRGLAVAMVIAATSAGAQVCYRLPFGNPNLKDGWGSTCCGRTNPHRGVDFPQALGTAIPAVAAGTVALRTFSSCLGNVVVIRHDDGWYSGYSHMRVTSPLGEGTRVAMGQTIGQVGSTGTCTTGPHLHLTIANTLGGYGAGATVDPVPFINARTTCNRAPGGSLDSATCSGIAGWAWDPDAPSTPIDVHVYLDGPAGAAGAYGFGFKANLRRPDLCAVYGCDHGFNVALPPAFFDGKAHAVHAYGIDTGGGPNPQLGSSPKTVTCGEMEVPEGSVRRLVKTPEDFKAWKLVTPDIAPLSDAKLQAITEGPELEPKPELVKIAGNDTVYVREASGLRPIPSMAVLNAWRFDVASITTVTADALADELRGALWRPAPLMVKGTAAAVSVIDAPPPLWAVATSVTVPETMVAGAPGEVMLELENKGSLEWTSAVQLAPTPRDEASPFCAPSWPSCTRGPALEGTVAPGGKISVRVPVVAPNARGEVKLCFGLVTGKHWFSDPGQLGPADDAICRTVLVTGGTAEVGAPGLPGQPSPPGPNDGADDVPNVDGGCGCDAAGGAFSLLSLAVATLLRRRRR